MTARFAHLSAPGVVLLRAELLASGYDDRAIAAMLRGKVLHRIRHGAYIDAHTWHQLDERGRYAVRCRAVVRQAKVPVVLSHTGAANEWGVDLWDVPLDLVDVTRPDEKAGRSAAGVRQHRGRLAADDVREWGGLQVTSPTRACLELASSVDLEHGLVVADSFLHRGLSTGPELDAMSRRMTYWPDTLRADLLVRLADGRSESVGETRTRHLCWMQGLPAPALQVEIHDRAGNVVARVDMAWPERGVFLEFDGRDKYQKYLRPGESVTDAVLREKRREELVCELTGWRCIRLVWADLGRQSETARRIRCLFRSAAA